MSAEQLHQIPPEQLGTDKLPVDQYISEELFAREKENLWPKTWLLVGRDSDLEKPGDYFVFNLDVVGASIVIVRSRDGMLRGFHNVCSHRGMRICIESKGSCKQFRCRYHNWVYDLEGNLRGVPFEEAFAEKIDRSATALKAISVDTWGGFVFINLDPEPDEPLADALGVYPPALETYLREQEWPWTGGGKVITNYNWKLSIDGAVDGYHGGFLHTETIFGRLQRDDMKVRLLGNSYGTMWTMRLRQPRVMQRAIKAMMEAGPDAPPPDGVVTPLMPGVTVPGSDENSPDEETMKLSICEMIAGKYSNVGNFTQGELKGDMKPDVVASAEEFGGAINVEKDPNWLFDAHALFPNTFLGLMKDTMMMIQSWPLEVNKSLFTYDFFHRGQPKNFGEMFARLSTVTLNTDIFSQDIYVGECQQVAFDNGTLDSIYLNELEAMTRLHQQQIKEKVG